MVVFVKGQKVRWNFKLFRKRQIYSKSINVWDSYIKIQQINYQNNFTHSTFHFKWKSKKKNQHNLTCFH